MMTESMVPAVQAEVTGDVPCRKCGYNLKGLLVAGRCPECGTPIGLSVSGDLLRYSDPGWLEGLRKGVSLFIWGIVAVIAGSIVTAIMGQGNATLGGVIGLAAQGLMLSGWWLMTQPDPSGL